MIKHVAMQQKETVAVIGAASEEGRSIVSKLAHASCRLLLMDEDAEGLAALRQSLTNTRAEIDNVPCCREASWEADLILIAKEQISIEDTAKKMAQVATTKTVIYLTKDNDDAFERLQQLLPHSRLVKAQHNNDELILSQSDAAAGVAELFRSAGFTLQFQ